MEYEGTNTLPTGPETAWQVVSDPEVLTRCVPGAKEVRRVSETTYEGVIERGIAGVSVSLEGDVEMVELAPPERVTVNASGTDSRTNSRMDARADLTLDEAGPGATSLNYTIDVEFTGRLATLGSRVVRRKIASDIDAFFENVRNHVEENGDVHEAGGDEGREESGEEVG